ncbi:MAG: ureidoglycolate lyase [Lachnospirales bacterium]
MKKIESITIENFAPYGSVLEFPKDCKEDFFIVETEKNEPWRLAVFRYRNKDIKTMEMHITSKESFEPLRGITVIVVALEESLDDYKAFVLDKPICLKKGIWHQVMSLTPESEVKITENLEVESEYRDLKKSISAYIG